MWIVQSLHNILYWDRVAVLFAKGGGTSDAIGLSLFILFCLTLAHTATSKRRIIITITNIKTGMIIQIITTFEELWNSNNWALVAVVLPEELPLPSVLVVAVVVISEALSVSSELVTSVVEELSVGSVLVAHVVVTSVLLWVSSVVVKSRSVNVISEELSVGSALVLSVAIKISSSDSLV